MYILGCSFIAIVITFGTFFHEKNDLDGQGQRVTLYSLCMHCGWKIYELSKIHLSSMPNYLQVFTHKLYVTGTGISL